MSAGDRLHRVGVMWKPKPGSKAIGTGNVTINGLRQRFAIFRNDRKDKDTQPDYVLMSSDEPEVDSFARDRESTPRGGRDRDDDIAF